MEYKKKRNSYIIIGILIVAALLRLWALSSGDPLTDEVLYGFRAIGMLDFDEAKDQTTPLEWFDERGIPRWTNLSFHDHPPLVFLAQNFSMRIFGDTNFGFRFPSVVFGVASVWLLYIIARRLYSDDIGLYFAYWLTGGTSYFLSASCVVFLP